ncbi:MAG: hypothetical protein U1U88_000168 [Lawsonella clevelandensis]
MSRGVSVIVVPFLLDENHFDMEAVGAAADAREDVIVVTPETPEGDEGEALDRKTGSVSAPGLRHASA